MDNDRVKAMRERLGKKAAVVQRVLATQDGQELMKMLREEFLYRVNMSGPTEAFRLGQCDVIAYLMQLNDHKEP